jgi:hypothetical protein
MDQPGPSQPPPASSTTENPIVAVGRKVKSILSTSQQPSIRILRPSNGEPSRMPFSKGIAEKLHLPHGNTQGPGRRAELEESNVAHAEASRPPLKGKSFASRFRSLFGREENNTDNEFFRDEYDADTVDLLDVMGLYDQPNRKAVELTLCRPGSVHFIYPHQCPKLPFRPLARKGFRSSTYV